MIQIPRYYIENTGVISTNERTIVNRAINLGNRPNLIIFITPFLDNSDIFKRLFPTINEKIFKSGVTLKDLNNLNIRQASYSQYLKTPFGNHVLISTYLDSEKIFDLEDIERAFANFVLPWGTTRVEKWARTTGAININTGLALDPYSVPQREVIDSLNKIMASVNLSGFSTIDMELVKREFKQLRKSGIVLNREEIEAYVMTHTHHFSWTFVKQLRKHSGI